jgi:hypothetical protein
MSVKFRHLHHGGCQRSHRSLQLVLSSFRRTVPEILIHVLNQRHYEFHHLSHLAVFPFLRLHLLDEVPVILLKSGGLVKIPFFGNLVEDYSLTFDVSVRHVAAENPSVFGAELVSVHLGGLVGG